MMMEDQIPLTSRNESSRTSIRSENSGLVRDPKVAVHRLKALFDVFGIAWQDAKLILEHIQEKYSRKYWAHIALVIVLMLALVSSGLIVIPSSENQQQYCDPGGNFDFAQSYNPWAREHTFQITLGFGKLTFTQAKAIDVVWDVVVGRGGQFLLTIICFHVFTKSLNLRLEQPRASISYDGFRAIVFERPSLSSTLMLILDLRSAVGWRTKASTLWIVIASIYVVAFPTMISAMTGYSSTVQPYFDDGTGKGKFPVPENGYFHRAIYLITGADRIENMSLDATYLVGSQGFGFSDWDSGWDPDIDYYRCLLLYGVYDSTGQNDCLLAHDITQYISAYGTRSSQTTNITLSLSDNRSLSVRSPGLTIEILNTITKWSPSVSSSSYYPVYSPLNLTLVNYTAPFMYTTTSGTRAFDETYLNNTGGTCDSQAAYLWGFSFILLFGFFVITGIWALGMYIMWIYTIRHSRLDRVDRTMGFYRGVADMSNAMWKDSLREPGELASDFRIRELLAQKLNGGRVTFDELDRDALPPANAHEFRRFRHGIPSLNGWTKTWGLLHWTWFLSFALIGLACFCHPMAVMVRTRSSMRFAVITGFAFAGISWTIALSILLAVIPGAVRIYELVPRSDVLSNPQSLAHWIWIAVFTASGGIHGFIAIVLVKSGALKSRPLNSLDPLDDIADSVEYAFLFVIVNILLAVAALFWPVAGIMLLTGLFSTLWRWSVQLTRIVSKSWRRHQATPLIQEDVSSRYRSVDDTEPE